MSLAILLAATTVGVLLSPFWILSAILWVISWGFFQVARGGL